MKHLIIVGAGGHGKVAADIAFKANKYAIISFLDDRTTSKIVGYDVIGKVSDYKKYIHQADFFVAIGDGVIREKLQNELIDNGANVVSLIHPSAAVALGVEIGVGCMVTAMAVIGPDAKVGNGAIINTACSVDHDCVVGDFAHISVGAHLAGMVSIGKQTMVGAGATVKNGIGICDNCLVGAGAVVVKNIFEEGIYVGVPARKMVHEKCE